MHKRGIRRPVIYSRPFSQIKLIPVNKALRGENRAVKPAGGKGEKMICPNCHSQIKEGSNFCPYCGYPIRRAEDATQAPPVGPSSDPEENPASASLQPSHQPHQPLDHFWSLQVPLRTVDPAFWPSSSTVIILTCVYSKGQQE